jgi:carbon monoxide dehydrogenase subunit G
MRRAIIGSISFLAASAALSSQGVALEVTRSLDIEAPPPAVWAIIGDFCAIEKWHPLVKRCSITNSSDDEGKPVAIRSMFAAENLGTIVEVQTRRDDKAMSYSYAYVEGPLPVQAYNATITVHPNGATSTVVWTATFDAARMSDAEAKADIEGVYEQGLAGIAKEAER